MGNSRSSRKASSREVRFGEGGPEAEAGELDPEPDGFLRCRPALPTASDQRKTGVGLFGWAGPIVIEGESIIVCRCGKDTGRLRRLASLVVGRPDSELECFALRATACEVVRVLSMLLSESDSFALSCCSLNKEPRRAERGVRGLVSSSSSMYSHRRCQQKNFQIGFVRRATTSSSTTMSTQFTLPSVLPSRPGMQDRTTTAQQIETGLARVTNPTE